jgi:hypothetical protein
MKQFSFYVSAGHEPATASGAEAWIQTLSLHSLLSPYVVFYTGWVKNHTPGAFDNFRPVKFALFINPLENSAYYPVWHNSWHSILEGI